MYFTGNNYAPVSSTNKTDRHDITEILLKVALNTINQTNYGQMTRPCPALVTLITDRE
jgi:hypothetical protein